MSDVRENKVRSLTAFMMKPQKLHAVMSVTSYRFTWVRPIPFGRERTAQGCDYYTGVILEAGHHKSIECVREQKNCEEARKRERKCSTVVMS